MIDYEMSYSVADVSGVPQAQNELYDRVYRAATAVGAQFSPRLASSPKNSSLEDKERVGVEEGTIVHALFVVSHGVLVGSVEENGRGIEVVRLATGDYFGESGLLTGEPLKGQVTALTRTVIYEISKDALSPLLKARPAIAEELSETLAGLQLVNRTVLDHHDDEERSEGGLADRVAATIRRLFSLH
jgi:CRP-like cAMP-binding protein